MNSICPMNFFRTTDTTDTTIWKPGLKTSSKDKWPRPHLYGEKLSRVGLPAYLSYFLYISLQNLANRLHGKQKVGSARGVTHLAGSLFCERQIMTTRTMNALKTDDVNDKE